MYQIYVLGKYWLRPPHIPEGFYSANASGKTGYDFFGILTVKDGPTNEKKEVIGSVYDFFGEATISGQLTDNQLTFSKYYCSGKSQGSTYNYSFELYGKAGFGRYIGDIEGDAIIVIFPENFPVI